MIATDCGPARIEEYVPLLIESMLDGGAEIALKENVAVVGFMVMPEPSLGYVMQLVGVPPCVTSVEKVKNDLRVLAKHVGAAGFIVQAEVPLVRIGMPVRPETGRVIVSMYEGEGGAWKARRILDGRRALPIEWVETPDDAARPVGMES